MCSYKYLWSCKTKYNVKFLSYMLLWNFSAWAELVEVSKYKVGDI